jgi:hypothetical protein
MEWKLAGFMLKKAKEDGTNSWSYNKAYKHEIFKIELLARTQCKISRCILFGSYEFKKLQS